MSRKKQSRPRTGKRRKPGDRGPSLVFYIALVLGLILLAYLGYIASTTTVTPPSVEQESE